MKIKIGQNFTALAANVNELCMVRKNKNDSKA